MCIKSFERRHTRNFERNLCRKYGKYNVRECCSQRTKQCLFILFEIGENAALNNCLIRF